MLTSTNIKCADVFEIKKSHISMRPFVIYNTYFENLNALMPAYLALGPSSSSMRSS